MTMATETSARKLTERQAKWQGGKWITPVRRLGIYLRDGMACVYCGKGVESDSVRLSLDHLKCHTNGGGNESSNLVTCCSFCNSSRGARSVAAFCRAVATYINHGADPKRIERHVRACAKRAVPIAEAKALLARRGGITASLKGKD
jgi:5-methylcytosine-specific restriction endonuclease McrA